MTMTLVHMLLRLRFTYRQLISETHVSLPQHAGRYMLLCVLARWHW